MSRPQGSFSKDCTATRRSGARMSTLTTLPESIQPIETGGHAYTPGRVKLGHADADATLQGGLAVGAMHEVFTDAGRQSAAATGFVAGLAGRAAARRALGWVRQDFTEIEARSGERR